MIRRAAIVLALAALFWVANRGAYKGFFSGDDLDTMAWNRHARWSEFARGLALPVYHISNFRPAAHAVYHILYQQAGMNFAPYVATVQALHLMNALLLFWLLRRLKFSEWASCAGALFWVFHMALFDNFWKPMYVYDVLCGTFSLLTLLAWTADLYLPALAAFWLGIKSKEHAIFLAPVLLAYEWFLGERRWKGVAPFFAVSFAFGLQALLQERPEDHPYRLAFSLEALAKTVPFYAPGLAALPLLIVWRDRRARFGIALLAAMISTLLFLPGRTFNAYLYVPLLGLAVCAAARAEVVPTRWMAAALALWLGFCFYSMRNYRRTELTLADENRAFFTQMKALGPALAEPELYAIDVPPDGLSWWGVSGMVRLLTGKKDATVLPTDWGGLRERALGKPVMQFTWRRETRELTAISRDSQRPDPVYLDFETPAPFWLLGDGWFKHEGNFRWTRARASITLRRPSNAAFFELRVNINPAHIAAVKEKLVRIQFDGRPFGMAAFTATGWQTRTWPVLPKAAESTVNVTLEALPLFRPENDPRELGIAVGAIGFRGTQP